MYRLKEKGAKRTIIVAAIAAAMIFCCVGAIYNTSGVADAFTTATITTGSTNLGEMLLEGYEEGMTTTSKVFDGDIFWALITQITGVANPDMNTLNGLGATAKTSADFRGLSVNGGKDVTVTINGIPWTATYLSVNSSGDPILTLWQADAVKFNYYNSSTNAMVSNTATATFSTSSNYTNAIAKYPSNSYGTSFMATNVLNNGGAWANTNTTTTNVAQNANNTYAKFTMDSVSGSLTSFIEVPNNMPFQKDATKESAKTQALHSSYKYDANNDALVAPTAANMYSTAYTYYGNASVDQTGYLAWGNDKIWLPSFAEVGYADSANGLWKTSTNQRAITSSLASYSWLRSAC